MDPSQSSHSVQYEHPSSSPSVRFQHLQRRLSHQIHHFCRLWRVFFLLPDRFKFHTRAPSFCPGRSSLHLGHGGVVLGQDLHQFVPPVKRVPEPAQLSRDLRGGGDFCGKTEYVTQVGSQAQIFKKKKNRVKFKPAVSNIHLSSPF